MNASPIILLAKVGQANLLLDLPGKLAVPEIVFDEIDAGPTGSSARQWLAKNEELIDKRSVDEIAVISSWDLGDGETAVLSKAYQDPDWTAIVDHRAARRWASALDISVTGTLGVLLLGKEDGSIPEVGPVLKDLVDAGLRISETLFNEVMRLAGEVE